jgi:hypothetical protein
MTTIKELTKKMGWAEPEVKEVTPKPIAKPKKK